LRGNLKSEHPAVTPNVQYFLIVEKCVFFLGLEFLHEQSQPAILFELLLLVGKIAIAKHLVLDHFAESLTLLVLVRAYLLKEGSFGFRKLGEAALKCFNLHFTRLV